MTDPEKIAAGLTEGEPSASAAIYTLQRSMGVLVAALRQIDSWCVPVLCKNCRDNRETARKALAFKLPEHAVRKVLENRHEG